MGTTDGFQSRDALRVCDVCGNAWHKSDLTRIGPLRWACPDDVDGLTAEQISRHNASVRPLTIKPVRNAKAPSQIGIYQQAEGDIFNLIVKYATQQIFSAESGDMGANLDTFTGRDQTQAAGWMALYLGNMALENRRPARWIAQATTKLLSLCDSMLANQIGLATYGAPNFRTWFGAFYMAPPTLVNGTSVYPLDVTGAAVCLMALLRAFQVSGLTKYRDGARNAARFLRLSQCPGYYLNVITYARANPSGARFLPGPFPTFISYDSNNDQVFPLATWTFKPSGIVCAWALQMLKNIDGDATYGDGAANDFAVSPAATLTQSIQACVDWWKNGAPDGSAGTVVAGFSVTTPKDSYLAYASGQAGNLFDGWNVNTATMGQYVFGYDYAAGVRGLWEVGGYTAQVSALYSWLRGFSADPANAPAATASTEQLARGLKGIYDPNTCLARALRVTNATGATTATEAGSHSTFVPDDFGPFYDWRTLGLLSPIQSSRDQGSFRNAKDLVSVARTKRRFYMRRSLTGQFGQRADGTQADDTDQAQYVRTDRVDDLRLLTYSGLSLQTSIGDRRPEWTGAGSLTRGHLVDLMGAAIIGDIYRHPPQAFPLEQG